VFRIKSKFGQVGAGKFRTLAAVIMVFAAGTLGQFTFTPKQLALRRVATGAVAGFTVFAFATFKAATGYKGFDYLAHFISPPYLFDKLGMVQIQPAKTAHSFTFLVAMVIKLRHFVTSVS
jgi:hypothetical protein